MRAFAPCRRVAALAVALAAGLAGGAAAAPQAYTPSITDYGGVGLLQTRTARFGDEGLFTIGASFADPYYRYYFSLHGLPGLEVGFRYTTIQNRGIISKEDVRGETAFQDKGADIKLRLIEEGRWRPAVAIGLQDFVGTAQFAGEYVVASKRFYDLDFTLGMGWGRLGTRAHLRNPLTYLSKSFEVRNNRGSDDQGGNVTLGQFFSGRDVALFGGVEWLTPLEGLRVKLEYDPNNYQQEPLGNRFKVDSAINVGIAYQPYPWLDVSVGFERGNTLLLRVAMTPNLIDPTPVLRADTPPPEVPPRTPPTPRTAKPGVPAGEAAAQAAARLFDGLDALGVVVEGIDIAGREATLRVAGPPDLDRAEVARVALAALPPPIDGVTVAAVLPDGTSAETRYASGTFELASALGVAVDDLVSGGGPLTEGERRAAAKAVMDALVAAEFSVEAVDLDETSATVFVGQKKYRATPQAVGRAARAVAASAPPSVEQITVVHLNSGLEVSRVSVMRGDIERALALRGSPEETFAHAVLTAGDGSLPPTAYRDPDRYPGFDWGLSPQLRQHVGGVDAFYLYQIWLRLSGDVQLTRNLSIHGALGANLYNNFDELVTDSATGSLPRVRSLIEQYLREGENNLVNLYASYVTNLGEGWYGRVVGGILEEMYAGIGAEVLYRPFDSRLAVGLDINHVYQRDFEQLFGFLDYDTTTGHVSFYYDTPFSGLHATVRLGRYLARDIGATFELAREFRGGIVMGAFATFTNVSAAEFGEGSFDKGVFVSIPLDLFFLRPTRRRANFNFRPLTRDGGQFVARPKALYAITGDDRYGRIVNDWGSFYQ